MKRSLRAQCILLPPPLVTSANSREASVFSIFLLMMLPQSIDCPQSVHLAAERDVHLAALSDVHFAGEPHVPSKGLKVVQPHADNLWLTIAWPDSTDAGLASHTLGTWTNGATSGLRSCQYGQHLVEGSRRRRCPATSSTSWCTLRERGAAHVRSRFRASAVISQGHDALRGEER